VERVRLLDTATAQENHERFLRRAVEHETVWTVWGGAGPLISESNGEPPPRDVYLFFSDEAYAQRALRESWPDCGSCSTRNIALFEFLHRWLPGLHRDGHLCGTNWTGDLIGLEIDPNDLRAELDEQLPDELKASYREMLASAK
jgi:hypothetical protein